jgi:hypothetical protein
MLGKSWKFYRLSILGLAQQLHGMTGEKTLIIVEHRQQFLSFVQFFRVIVWQEGLPSACQGGRPLLTASSGGCPPPFGAFPKGSPNL